MWDGLFWQRSRIICDGIFALKTTLAANDTKNQTGFYTFYLHAMGHYPFSVCSTQMCKVDVAQLWVLDLTALKKKKPPQMPFYLFYITT